MTSGSIQDVSGLMYQKQVKGQKNTASDENDLKGRKMALLMMIYRECFKMP